MTHGHSENNWAFSIKAGDLVSSGENLIKKFLSWGHVQTQNRKPNNFNEFSSQQNHLMGVKSQIISRTKIQSCRVPLSLLLEDSIYSIEQNFDAFIFDFLLGFLFN